MKQTNLLSEIIKIQSSKPFHFTLSIDGNTYRLDDVIISEKSTPLTKKASRGGVYIS